MRVTVAKCILVICASMGKIATILRSCMNFMVVCFTDVQGEPVAGMYAVMYRCYPSRFTPLPHANGTADDAYQRTMDRESTLRARGYTVRSIWECEMKQQIRESEEMKLYFKVLVNHK